MYNTDENLAKKAPYAEGNTRKGREEEEEENDTTEEIYNYIFAEEWMKMLNDVLILGDFKIDIFYEFNRKKVKLNKDFV